MKESSVFSAGVFAIPARVGGSSARNVDGPREASFWPPTGKWRIATARLRGSRSSRGKGATCRA